MYISSVYFIGYPSVSDHKPLIVYLQENYHKWIIFVTKKKKKKKKKLLGGIDIKYFELKKENFMIPINFDNLSEELGNEEISVDSIVEKFINTIHSINKDLSITSSTEIKKSNVLNAP